MLGGWAAGRASTTPCLGLRRGRSFGLSETCLLLVSALMAACVRFVGLGRNG